MAAPRGSRQAAGDEPPSGRLRRHRPAGNPNQRSHRDCPARGPAGVPLLVSLSCFFAVARAQRRVDISRRTLARACARHCNSNWSLRRACQTQKTVSLARTVRTVHMYSTVHTYIQYIRSVLGLSRRISTYLRSRKSLSACASSRCRRSARMRKEHGRPPRTAGAGEAVPALAQHAPRKCNTKNSSTDHMSAVMEDRVVPHRTDTRLSVLAKSLRLAG